MTATAQAPVADETALSAEQATIITRYHKAEGLAEQLDKNARFILANEAELEKYKGIKKELELKREMLTTKLTKTIQGEGDELWDSVPLVAAGEKAPPVAQDDTTWRAVELSTLGIKGKLLAVLDEKNIKTIGDVADMTGDGWGRLTDVPGVGKGNAEKVEKALDRYWAAHPRVEKIETVVVDASAPGPALVVQGGKIIGEQEIKGSYSTMIDGLGQVPVVPGGALVLPLDQKFFDIIPSALSHYPDMPVLLQGEKPPAVKAILHKKKASFYASLGVYKAGDKPEDRRIRLVRLTSRASYMRDYGSMEFSDKVTGGMVDVDGEKYLICPPTQDIYVHLT